MVRIGLPLKKDDRRLVRRRHGQRSPGSRETTGVPVIAALAKVLFVCVFSMEMARLGILLDRSVKIVESVVIARK